MNSSDNSLAKGIQLHIAIKLAFILYVIFSIFHKSPFPSDWNKEDIFLFWALIFSAPLVIYIDYHISKKGIDAESLINNFFDIHKLKNEELKYLDCFISHYTNVATVGLFLMVVIYLLKPISYEIPITIIGPILAALCFIIFFIYGLFITRLASGLLDTSKPIYFLSIYGAIYIDMQVIEIFIKSTPIA